MQAYIENGLIIFRLIDHRFFMESFPTRGDLRRAEKPKLNKTCES